MKKQKTSANKKSANAQLAAGAEKIRKAQKAKEEKGNGNGKGKAKDKKAIAPKVEPVVIPESTRPIEDILKDRVTVLPGSIGLRLADDIPIEESLRVLDYTTTLSDHVGFMIGDVINYGEAKWGETYTAALNQTGRAKPTLKEYASVARRIAPKNRVAALTYTHHREILRIGNDEKIATVLKEVGAQAEKGLAPTTREVKEKVQKLTPRKVKKPKKATSGKGKKKAKPEPPPYEPTSEEQAKLDSIEDGLTNLNKEIESSGVEKILLQLDNKEKCRWTETLLLPIFELYQTVERHTGY